MTALLPGTQVEARGLRWEVVHVEPAGAQQRFRLRCADGALRGMELDLLHPFETIQPIVSELDPAHPSRLRGWQLYHEAFLLEQALGPRALLAVDPGRLDIAPYQLVPVMRALEMGRPRLLLADGVGLGKTIQAGLVMAELIARRRAHRILIVTPAGPLLEQWHREMRERFGLRFTAITSWGELQEVRRSLVLGANPFDHLSFCILSIDFAKQEKVLQDLERAAWDLVVIDEAHHCVRIGSAGDAEDSRRRRLAEVLAQQADGLLLLTATPHDGFDPHFASLVGLLDPSLLDGRGSLRGDTYRRHVVRRLKDHIKEPRTGAPLFRTRKVEPRAVPFGRETHREFADYQLALMAMVAPRLKRAVKQKRYGEVLAFVSLLKRSVSTVVACKNTLSVIRDRYVELVTKGAENDEARKQRIRTLNDYRRRLERYGTLSYEEEQDQAALEAEDMAAEIAGSGVEELTSRLGELRRERERARRQTKAHTDTQAALDELIQLADLAVASDPKLVAILAEVQAIRAAEPAANILIYSEYTDSQDAVVAHLREAQGRGALTGEILEISGADPEKVRSTITKRFRSEDDLIIVSTDATAEGLNLHDRCHHLIHVELPYNPNRLEQRNGRIDRYGQKFDPIVRYLYLGGTFEERLLLRLIAKYERQRARLTFVPNTLGGLTTDDATTVRLLEGLADDEPSLFQQPPRAIRQIEEAAANDDHTSPAFRELLAEVERAVSGFDKLTKNHSWLGDAGLSAEAKLVTAANEAREQGRHLGAVDLLEFVSAAVESEARAEVVERRPDRTLQVQLGPDWIHGLDDMPGYTPETRTILLTADPSITSSGDREVGYLGRAHPLVRRALDRVRNLRFGDAEARADRRVSAIQADLDAPALLLTFLGVVESAAGHEFERVVAVQVAAQGEPTVFIDPSEWEPEIRDARQAHLAGVWERHFAAWAPPRRGVALDAARAAFSRLAGPFMKEHRARIAEERDDLLRWLRARTMELCGPVEALQGGLFDAGASAGPSWKTLSDPLARLAAFASDSAVRPLERREANGVLQLYSARLRDLDTHDAPRVREPMPLGLLMLVPRTEGGR